MTNQATQTHTVSELIERVMEAFVDSIQSDEPFTILDISEKVKNDGGPFVRHRDVHEVAKPIFNASVNNLLGDWTHTDIEVVTNSGPAHARLYHPIGFNPDNYTQRNKVATKPQQAPQPHQQSNVDTQPYSTGIPGAQLDVPAKIRSDGAIEIPLAVLISSNLLDKTVFVKIHPNSITVSTQPDVIQMKASKGCRVRKMTLTQANLTKNVRYAVFTDKIVIYQA
jgi:hypothetical protein